jgi:hypothetical protein
VEGASGLGSDGIGVLSVERVLGPIVPARLTREPRSGRATGSVCGLIVRPVQRKTTPAHGLTPLDKKREAAPGKQARRGEGEVECSFQGAIAEVPRLAHATPIAAPLGVGDAFGLSSAKPEDSV